MGLTLGLSCPAIVSPWQGSPSTGTIRRLTRVWIFPFLELVSSVPWFSLWGVMMSLDASTSLELSYASTFADMYTATLWKTLATGKTSSRRPLHLCRAMISSPRRFSQLRGQKDLFTSTRPLSPGLAGAGSGFEDGRRKMPAVSVLVNCINRANDF